MPVSCHLRHSTPFAHINHGTTKGEIMEAEIDRFLYSRKYSDRTRESYRYMLRQLFDAFPTGLDQLTPSQLGKWVERKTWANSTQYLACCAARAFLTWRYGINCSALAYKFRRDPPEPQRTLTAEEVDALYKSFPPDDYGRRNLAIVSLAVDTGLRASELCHLTLDHLHLSEKSYLQIQTKGGKWQTKGFSLITAFDIDNWLSIRDYHALDGVDTVFVSIGGNTPGESMTRDGLRAIVRAWAKRAGLTHFSPHAFRRTGATLAALNGASDEMLMKQFGWKHAEQVRRYLQALTADTFPQLYSPVSSIRK